MNFARIALISAVLVFFLIAGLSFYFPQADPFMPVLFTGIFFFGFPHGALDIILLMGLSLNRKQLLSWVTVYIIAVLSMVVSWTLIPTGAFLFFVLYSCFHFAQSDLTPGPQGIDYLEFAARFLAPFFIPFGLQNERSIQLASYIHDTSIFEELSSLFYILGVLAIVLSVLVVMKGLYYWLIEKKEWLTSSLEPLVISILFVFLDPIYSLAIYFCFIHSVKHIINFSSSRLSFNMKLIIPYWMAPVALALILSFVTSASELTISQDLFKWSIIIISSIALPHTFLVYFVKKLKIIT